MSAEYFEVKCSIVRGGTSKAVFIPENELPTDMELRKKTILAIFGSPDIRQIDGLGGADLLTSKLAVVGPPSIPEADVDYSFAQVGLDDDRVEFDAICGNISSGVGPWAINNNLVKPVEPVTTVRIHMTGIGKIMTAQVPVKDGKALVCGDFAIDGVPGTGAPIALDWKNIVGGKTGRLLPTGKPVDVIEHDGRQYHVTLVDAGSITVFLSAEELGVTGTETPQAMEANGPLMELIEALRGKAAVMAGLCGDWRTAKTASAYLPFAVVVSPAQDYVCFNGREVSRRDISLTGRLYTMGKINKTYAGSGAVCTGVAARIPGSLVWSMMTPEAREKDIVTIGHCSGSIPVESSVTADGGKFTVEKVNIFRTARVIMDGTVYVRRDRVE